MDNLSFHVGLDGFEVCFNQRGLDRRKESERRGSFNTTSANMSVDAHRRISNTYDPSDFIGSTRRVSLREMPSFRNDASKALDRRDDLQKLKAKLSFNREILHSADPASQPWLRKTSGAAAPIRESKDEADAGHGRAAGRMDEMYSLHTASPAQVSPTATGTRPRNLSRGTSASADSSEGGFLDQTYDSGY